MLFPNIILPLVNGFIVDTIGVRYALAIFVTITLTAQSVCTLGVYNEDYHTLLIGRFMTGLSNEGQMIARSVLITKWFLNYELGLGLGLLITTGRFGTAFASIWYPNLYA